MPSLTTGFECGSGKEPQRLSEDHFRLEVDGDKQSGYCAYFCFHSYTGWRLNREYPYDGWYEVEDRSIFSEPGQRRLYDALCDTMRLETTINKQHRWNNGLRDLDRVSWPKPILDTVIEDAVVELGLTALRLELSVSQLARFSGRVELATNDNDGLATWQSIGMRPASSLPLMKCHTGDYYRDAIEATGDLLVHTHFGGRFERQPDGSVARLRERTGRPRSDERAFLKAAKDIVNYDGHVGYELCSPVLIGHRHAGLDCALLQAELASEYMRQIIESL